MSIVDEIAAQQMAGKLVRFQPRPTRRPLKRELFLTEGATRTLNDPQSATNILCGRGHILAAMERWVRGELVYANNNQGGFLKRLCSPPPEIWEIRVTEPVNHARLFARFARPNTLIMTHITTRWLLGDKIVRNKPSSHWAKAMMDCEASWNNEVSTMPLARVVSRGAFNGGVVETLLHGAAGNECPMAIWARWSPRAQSISRSTPKAENNFSFVANCFSGHWEQNEMLFSFGNPIDASSILSECGDAPDDDVCTPARSVGRHELSNLIGAVTCVRGEAPRSKVSMTFMCPPQQGHGGASASVVSVAPVLSSSSCRDVTSRSFRH